MKHSSSIISKGNRGKKIESKAGNFDRSLGDGKGRDKPQSGLQKNTHGGHKGQNVLLLERDSRSLWAKIEGKVSLAETLKDWLSRKEIYSFSCSVFRKMAGVPLKDLFSSTDVIKRYAHKQSRYQN